MFTGFTEGALDFLSGIRANNNKEWFEAHKQEYTEKVYEPLKELGEAIYAPYEGTELMYKVGRIYRDTNFPPYLHYRDVMWIYVRYPAWYWNKTPTLYFELSPEGAEYGFRIAKPDAAVMERFRAQISEDPEAFPGLMKQLTDSGLTIGGEEYKRTKKCEIPELAEYYRKKGLSVYERCEDAEILFSEKLTERIREVFRKTEPLNEMFHEIVEIEELAKAIEKENLSQPQKEEVKAPDVEFMW